MFVRIHCDHCDKFYETFLEDVRLMQKNNAKEITFTNNTYYYKSKKCFFTSVKRLKSSAPEDDQ